MTKSCRFGDKKSSIELEESRECGIETSTAGAGSAVICGVGTGVEGRKALSTPLKSLVLVMKAFPLFLNEPARSLKRLRLGLGLGVGESDMEFCSASSSARGLRTKSLPLGEGNSDNGGLWIWSLDAKERCPLPRREPALSGMVDEVIDTNNGFVAC
jgi:hypothetical protein